jgi:hypothetical protein
MDIRIVRAERDGLSGTDREGGKREVAGRGDAGFQKARRRVARSARKRPAEPRNQVCIDPDVDVWPF